MVWGWLAILMGGRRPRTWRNALPVGVATAVFTLTIVQLISWTAATQFGGGAILGLLLHIGFLQGLALRYKTTAETTNNSINH